jgi:hypothetical protein
MAKNNRNEDICDLTLTTKTPENDNKNIPPIFEYQGPTDDKMFEQELGKTTRIEVPSFRPIYDICRNKFLDDRRIEALEAGANAFDKLQLLTLRSCPSTLLMTFIWKRHTYSTRFLARFDMWPLLTIQ